MKIIGGGIAGLTAGIYGQMNGYDTEIYEMHHCAGGQCTAWDREGYRFDYCLHWLVGSRFGAYHQIWRETGALNEQTELYDPEVHVTLVDPTGQHFRIYTNLDRWQAYLESLAPEDTSAIRQMVRHIRLMRHVQAFEHPPALRTFRDYSRSIWNVLPAFPVLLRFGRSTCARYFDALGLTNTRLRSFLDGLFGGQGFSAIAFLMMLSWFDQGNASYIQGGSLPLIQRMVDRYRQLGGRLHTNSRVARILIENDRAVGLQLVGGERVSGDIIVSAADGHTTLFEMIDARYRTAVFEDAYRNWPVFTPIVQVSLGIDGVLDAPIGSITHLDRKAKIGSTSLEDGFNLMNYSFDPSMAPPGKTVLALRYSSPWNLWKDLEGPAYAAEKRAIEEDVRKLLDYHYRGLSAQIEVVDIATPLTNVRYTGVWKGAFEGFLPSTKNVGKELPLRLKGLDNFYLCGQWLVPGGGLPPSAQSGRWVVELACHADGKAFQTSIPESLASA